MSENITPEMIVNGASNIPGGSTFSDEDRQEIAVAVYRAMIASAPPQEGVRETIARIIKAELVFCLTSEPDESVEIDNAEAVADDILSFLRGEGAAS